MAESAGNVVIDGKRIADKTFKLEDVLDRMRKQVLHATPELISLILRAVDLMRQMVPTVTDKQRQVPSELVRLMADLARRCSSSAGEGPTPAPAPDGAGAIAKGHGGR